MRKLFLLAALLTAACANTNGPDPATMDEATFDRELAKRFQYGPPEPAPTELANAAAGQSADATYFIAFPDFDRAYTSATRARAREMAARLRADAANLSHEQFVLRIAEIAALADNGHTAIGENAFKKNTPRLPLRTYPFADGLHVVLAGDSQRDLLGARIDTIGGLSIDRVYARLRRYAGGTDAHRRLQVLPVLESPALLQAAGIGDSRTELMIAGVLADGTRFERRITAEDRDRSAWVSSSQRLVFATGLERFMASYLGPAQNLPVYLRHPSDLFVAEALPQEGFYVGIGFNGDADDQPIGPWLDTQLARVRREHPTFVVVDMRMNGGGDYTRTYAFAHALPEAAGDARIYVLTSGWTFSAAITTVAALKDAGGDQVTIVGEPVGDRLDFWAEGGTFDLPNAFVQVHYAAGRHNYAAPCRDRAQCFWLNERYPVRVATLQPDIDAPLTFAAYREHRDPAVDAVLAREASSRSSARTP